MAAFPNYAKLKFDGFARNRDSAVQRTQMEGPIAKQIKVRSRVGVQRPVVYALDYTTDYANFITWFNTTINRGASWFDWTDPVDGVTKTARIVNGEIAERPVRKNLDRWEVSFRLEVIDA